MSRQNPRQLAFIALRSVHRGAFSDVALDRVLQTAQLSSPERGLVTELVYGSVRRQRTLDALIDQLGKKKAHQQPADLRIILHLGLYQLRYLNQVNSAAAVNSTVQLAKTNGLAALAGVVNGMLRQYIRLGEGQDEGEGEDQILLLPENPIERLGILYSFPDWIVQVWRSQLSWEETEQLCQWMNQPPTIDLRVNPLQTSIEEVETAMQSAGIAVSRVPPLPQALRLTEGVGTIQNLPGFSEGWWTIQDSSAQLVGYLLDPQPGEVVIDACAAPGGKTTHIAELMGDRGTIWAGDRTMSRLKKVKENAQRLHLQSIKICHGDSRNLPQFIQSADRVLLDAPCSGMGTLQRRADARWRQTPETVLELSHLQGELLEQAATWVKPGGIVVYSTCTLNPVENENVIQAFLDRHPDWQIDPPDLLSDFTSPNGWIKVWPQRQQMDGFFMVRLKSM